MIVDLNEYYTVYITVPARKDHLPRIYINKPLVELIDPVEKNGQSLDVKRAKALGVGIVVVQEHLIHRRCPLANNHG